jgi:lipid II:glycine glycyltransferase (peptidoglycan interpeptide bridge formation enzyme)
MTIRKALQSDQKIWNTYVDHPLQSWEWGEFRKKSGHSIDRFVQTEGNKIISCFQLTYHKIPHTDFTIGYFPKGPLPTVDMIQTLKISSYEHNAIMIQLEPNVFQNKTSLLLKELHLIPSHHPLFTKYTFILDLTKSEEELLSSMHSKTRYNIKVAQKHNVVTKQDSSKEAFNNYLKLENETTSRQKFYAHTNSYHENMWDMMSQADIAKLWTANIDNETLASWILFLWKDTIYYPYGASSRNKREVMAPNLLLWEIVKWGKKNGYKKFDLWGALGPNPNEHDPWYGFHRFKSGYNPKLVEFIGSYDLVINPILYKFYCLADIVRWKILKKLK